MTEVEQLVDKERLTSGVPEFGNKNASVPKPGQEGQVSSKRNRRPEHRQALQKKLCRLHFSTILPFPVPIERVYFAFICYFLFGNDGFFFTWD